MSVTRIICPNGCGFPIAFCKCEDLVEIVLHEDFGDPESLLNSREWLRAALEKAGATFDGGGIGMGKADCDITLEGFRFNVSIKPLN